MSKTAELQDMLRRAGHVLGNEEPLRDYHTARAAVGAKRAKDPVRAVREALRGYRVVVAGERSVLVVGFLDGTLKMIL